MKKALKISAFLMALIVMAAFAVVFTVGAEEIDNTNFFDKMAQGGTFELKEDIGTATDTQVIILGETVTLDLKGHTIYSGVTGGLFTQGVVANPGTIKIIDTVGGGAIIAPDAEYLLDSVAGTVRIEGGTIIAKNFVSASTTAVVTIKGSGKVGDLANDTANGGAITPNTTWTSFDPTAWLVDDYSTDAEVSPVAAGAGYRVFPTEYKINYIIPGNATNTLNPGYYTIETPDITLAPASAKGYEFVEWKIRLDGVETGIKTIGKGTSLREITLVGVFEVIEYNVSYVLGNGVVNNPSNPVTFTVEMADIPLGRPSLYGYEFKGWFDANNVEVFSIKCAELINTSAFTGDTYVLTPKFEVIPYHIDFITFEGLVDPSVVLPSEYNVDTEVDISLDAYKPSKPGYIFSGWFEDPYEGDVPVTKIEKGNTGNITFYARYEVEEYSIEYESDPAITNTEDFQTKFYVTTPTFKIPSPAPVVGYTFQYWLNVTDPANPVRIDYVEVGTHEDLKIKAVWEETKFPLRYELMVDNYGDVNNAENTTEWFTYNQKVLLAAASRDKYIFGGWYYEDPTGKEGEALESIALGKEGDFWVIPAKTDRMVTVYALWIPEEFEINYDADGYTWEVLLDADGNYDLDANGDLQYDKTVIVPLDKNVSVLPAVDTYTTVFTVEDEITLPVPTRAGYKFIGWSDPDTGLFYAAADTMKIEAGKRGTDFRLEAQWEIGKYDLVIEYRYSNQYFLANKEALEAVATYEDAQVMWSETVSVVFGTGYTHEVTFREYDHFVPDYWFVSIDKKTDEVETLVVYFEPVLKNAEYVDGKLVYTYYNGSKTEIAIDAITSVYVEGNGIYVKTDKNANGVQVGTIPSTQDFEKLTETVNKLSQTLNEYKTTIDGKADKTYVDAEIAKVITSLTTAIDDKIDVINQDIDSINETISALQSKASTSIVLAVIALVVAIGAVVAAVVIGKKN